MQIRLIVTLSYLTEYVNGGIVLSDGVDQWCDYPA